MSFKRLSLALAGILAVTLTQQLAAQTCIGNPCSVNNAVSARVPTLLRLTLTPITTTLTSPSEAAFDAGSQDDPGPTATVKANGPWNLTIAAQTPAWTGTSGGRGDKAAGDLQWDVGSGTFTSLSTIAANVYGSSQPAGTTPTAFTYRTRWSYEDDVPGDYALTVVYTVTAP
jgi:hypothetical protein